MTEEACCETCGYSLQVACATLELVFRLRVRQMKAPASINFERSTPCNEDTKSQVKLRSLSHAVHTSPGWHNRMEHFNHDKAFFSPKEKLIETYRTLKKNPKNNKQTGEINSTSF